MIPIKQKVVITKNPDTLTSYLNEGYVIKSITAQHVATGCTFRIDGDFCFLLEKY